MALREAAPGQLSRSMPSYHSALMRVLIAPKVAERATFQENRRLFEAVNQQMLKILREIPQDQWNVKVENPSQLGVEKESKNFSALMTLEHVVAVGEIVKSIVRELSLGITMDRIISTSYVIPRGCKPPDEIVQDFQRFSDTAMADLEPDLKDLDFERTIAHPWYGPFNITQWHWMLAGHSVIHCRQMGNIKKTLLARLASES